MEDLKKQLETYEKMLSDFNKRLKKAEDNNENLKTKHDKLVKMHDNLVADTLLMNVFKKPKEDFDDESEMQDIENIFDDNEDDLDIDLSIYKRQLYTQTKFFLKQTSFAEFEHEMKKLVIGQDISLLLTAVYQFLQQIVREKCKLTTPPARILVTGPSGCGKTHIYRSLARYFSEKIPALQIIHNDVSNITSSGFKGRNIESVFFELIESEGLGICFLSEIDKFIMPKYDGKGQNMAEVVTGEFLSILEGTVLKYAHEEHIRTMDTLFICDGSFNGIRAEKQKKKKEKTVGFLIQEQHEYDIYDKISREDILRFGATYELLGRFTFICQLEKLSENAIFMIIMGYQQQISNALNIELYLSNSYIVKLMELANGEFGCRLLYSKIYEDALNAVAEGMRLGMKEGFLVNLFKESFELHAIDEKMPELKFNFSDYIDKFLQKTTE